MAGRKWPVEEIPEGGMFAQVPVGPYRVTVQLAEALSSSNKLMYKVVGRIIAGPIGQPETGEHVGNLLGENFTIGTDTDREADDPDTWRASIGARQMRQLFAAAGVEPSEDVDEMVDAVGGREVIWWVTNRIEAVYPPQVTDKGQPVMAARNRLQRFDPVTAANGQPVNTPPPPMPPASEAGAARRPVGRPKATAATATAQAPAAAPAAPKPTPAAKPDLLTCPSCQETVPRKEFPAHAAACTAGEEE